jgi:hypothetical protein
VQGWCAKYVFLPAKCAADVPFQMYCPCEWPWLQPPCASLSGTYWTSRWGVRARHAVGWVWTSWGYCCSSPFIHCSRISDFFNLFSHSLPISHELILMSFCRPTSYTN